MAEHTNAFSRVPSQAHTSGQEPAQRRRNMLAGLSVYGVLSALCAPVAAAGDPHIEWEKQIALLRLMLLPDLPDDEYDALLARIDNLGRRMALTPARTARGVACQVRMALAEVELWAAVSDAAVIALRQAAVELDLMPGGC